MDVNVGGSRLLREIFEAGVASLDKRAFYIEIISGCMQRHGIDDRGVLPTLETLDLEALREFDYGLIDGKGREGKQAFVDQWVDAASAASKKGDDKD